MIRVRWAAAWIDRAEKTRVQIDEMEGGMILRQIIVTREEAGRLASDIDALLMDNSSAPPISDIHK